MTAGQVDISAADEAQGPGGLFGAYRTDSQVPDEMMDARGAVRPHWQMITNLLDDLGPTELERRWATSRQLIHDNGVTYNVYGDPAGLDRPWVLDALPLVFSASEWATLSEGLIQRARVLDLALADLYGPQKLLQDSVIPPEVIFANPSFLRPLRGVRPEGNRWLHMAATDVGRNRDGTLCILTDRTQAPSGAGYALENRIVISRALPDIFRDCRVSRLATFFRSMRNLLQMMAPRSRENPRIVLLTPGPYNETYFEHAYLARYLGYTLVEGADLTVRDNRVYMKMLGGLQQVDVILRRQDDVYCDPLELLPDSALGIPGLVQAVHSGQVTVANALGSGVMESPAIEMFIPRICRHLLGEELRLPAVRSYWCGDPEALGYVLANLSRILIKPAFYTPGQFPIPTESLTHAQLAELRSKIIAYPSEFVGEEQIPLSTAPILANGRVEPRHIAFRAHMVANADTYTVMPGGLTRFSISPDSMIVAMQRGGGSKDTWILSGGPVDPFSFLTPPGAAVRISRAGGDLSSRVADNLFWLGRYVERAESLARLARGMVARLVDQNFESSAELPILLTALIAQANLKPHEIADQTRESLLAAILLDAKYTDGLQSTLGAIYQSASLVRDRMSIDTWRIINRLDQDFTTRPTTTLELSELLASLDKLIVTFAAFGGLAMESMTRGLAWRFLDMGRRIERGLSMAQLCIHAMTLPQPREGLILEALLEIADSAITYRRRYMTTLQVPLVADLLLADETNPRAVAFQLMRMQEHLGALPRLHQEIQLTPADQIILRRLTELRLADFSLLSPMEGAQRTHLRSMLETMTADLFKLSDLLSQTYLSHAGPGRQLGSPIPASAGKGSS